MADKKDSNSDLKRRLRIKYGLMESPTDEEIGLWERLVRAAVEKGEDAEEAGREAAFEAFDDVDAVALFSEADTIEALLKKAAQK